LIPKHLNKILKEFSKEKENSELVEDIISFYWSYVRKAISNKEYYNINLKGLGSFVINEKKLNQALAKKYQHIASLDKKQYTSFAKYTDLQAELKKLQKVKDQIVKEKDRRIKLRQANYADQSQNNLEE
jgi:nucleoid DNA-binding protein